MYKAVIHTWACLLLAASGCTGQEHRAGTPLPDDARDGITEAALVWEGREDGCLSMLLDAEGRAAVGPCDAPHAPRRLLNAVNRTAQWKDMLARFAPFEAARDDGRLVFRGQGDEEASPAWQRAVAAWARLAALEMRAGRSGASLGAAMAAQWDLPERPGYCRFLAVEMYGFAYTSTARCEGGEPELTGQAWVDAADWEQFSALYYGRAAFDGEALHFYGQGTQALSEAERDALRQWAERVYARTTRA